MKKPMITVVIALLLFALALYCFPWPQNIEFRGTCVEVDRQGNILSDEGEIFLKGTYYHYLFQRDTFQLTDLELPGMDSISVIEYDTGEPVIMNAPRGYDFIWIPCAFHQSNPTGYLNNIKTTFATIFTHSEFPYLIFECSGDSTGRYFVTTNEGAPAPVEMLKEFCLYLEETPN